MTAQLAVFTTEDNEQPTKPVHNLHSSVLSALACVDRLAELAIERLLVDPDPHAIVEALADLAKIRGIARSVTK